MGLSRAVWRKSARSTADGCVEVGVASGQIAVRDAKAAQGPALVFSAVEWPAFISGVRGGEFDLPAGVGGDAEAPHPRVRGFRKRAGPAQKSSKSGCQFRVGPAPPATPGVGEALSIRDP